MSICKYVYVYVYTYIFILVYIHTYIHVYLCIYMFFLYACTYTSIYLSMHESIWIHLWHMWIRTQIHKLSFVSLQCFFTKNLARSSRGKMAFEKKMPTRVDLDWRSTSTAVLPCQDRRELSVHHREGWTETVTSRRTRLETSEKYTRYTVVSSWSL